MSFSGNKCTILPFPVQTQSWRFPVGDHLQEAYFGDSRFQADSKALTTLIS